MKKINAFHLKLIAIIAMLINHIGHTFEFEWNPPFWEFIYLVIGLLTFPIMAYLLVEGFFYSRNRWKYAGRLFLFGLLSMIPFFYLFEFYWPFFNPVNNIMFTLMFGIFMMMICEKISQPILQAFILIAFIFVTILSDWNVFGIPLIFAFYKNHGKPEQIRKIIVSFCIAMFLLSIPENWDASGLAQVFSSLGLLGVIPLLENYNGQRGYCPAWVKWGFYAFYPLHISILWLVRFLIFKY